MARRAERGGEAWTQAESSPAKKQAVRIPRCGCGRARALPHNLATSHRTPLSTLCRGRSATLSTAARPHKPSLTPACEPWRRADGREVGGSTRWSTAPPDTLVRCTPRSSSCPRWCWLYGAGEDRVANHGCMHATRLGLAHRRRGLASLLYIYDNTPRVFTRTSFFFW